MTRSGKVDDPQLGEPDPRVVLEETAVELVVSLHRLLRTLHRARPEPRLQPTPFIVLVLLNRYGPSRIGVLADRVPCTQPTVTATVAQLEAEGLVAREPDPADGRAIQVAITASGSDALCRIARSEADALLSRLGVLSPQEVRQVLEVGPFLRRLAESEPR
ncbi:MarR family winged helix-turn-helix transcriptional regulator [Streptomyces sp. NPDC089424]|uniref:MarR family winged helix-turn-helix transcriptional regulator n=1 Tax=Streptomyces sp. NPDC089424 TaxID=3365917 RepID=UPI003808DE9C